VAGAVLGLWWCGAIPMTGSVRFARYGAFVMMAVLTVIEGLAVTVPRRPLDGTPPACGVVYGVYTALLGVALLAVGLGVARGGAWQGWKRWLPLCLGVNRDHDREGIAVLNPPGRDKSVVGAAGMRAVRSDDRSTCR
jgi:hypothetical protein